MFIGVFGPLFKKLASVIYLCFLAVSIWVPFLFSVWTPVWWLVLKYFPHSACSLFSVAYSRSQGKDPLMATFAFAALALELLTKTPLSDSVSQQSPLFSSNSFPVLRLPVNSLINLDWIFVFNESQRFLFLSFTLPFPLPSFPLLFLAFRIPVLPHVLRKRSFP